MATFKVGQRVRVIAAIKSEDRTDNYERHPGMIGREATILTNHWVAILPPNTYVIRIDGLSSKHHTGAFCALSYQLVPLTDPRAEEFIADMERFSVASRPKEIA